MTAAGIGGGRSLAESERRPVIERIRSNIASSGHHVTLVQGGPSPRFAYTVGLSDPVGHEVILAGGISLLGDAVKQALDQAVAAGRQGSLAAGLIVDGVGSFRVRPVHPSWAEELLLGAFDFYDRDVEAVQLVPEGKGRTIDVPDLSVPWSAEGEPIWRWLKEEWTYDFLPTSVAVTNLEAMRGQLISEAARWEEADWEMFAGPGPDVPHEDMRVVPLATLLGFDPSLEPVTRLEVGRALRRVPPGPWERWGK